MTYRQTVGFVGFAFACEVDTAVLPAEEAMRLLALVTLEDIDKVGRMDPVGRDAIQYEVTIESKGDVRRVRFGDLTMPQPLLPLLSYLRSLAKPLLQ